MRWKFKRTQEGAQARASSGTSSPAASSADVSSNPADVGVADEDLRDGAAAAGAGHHFFLLRRVEVDANLFDLGDAAALEQALCGDAVRADGGAIHYDFGHEGLLVT